MLKQWSRNRLLLVPLLLVMTLLLTACQAPVDVAVGEVVERETGEIVEDATITMTLVSNEGKELSSKSCQNCQTLSERIGRPTRGDRVIIRVEAPGYVPWQAESSSSQAIPPASTGTGLRVELTPLAQLGEYRTQLAAAVEQVENLLAEAQRRQFPREAFEQPLSDALAGLHQADENLAGLVATTPPSSLEDEGVP